MIGLYARSHTLISWLIRFDTWSPWSHIAIYVSADNTVIEARFPGIVAMLRHYLLRKDAPGVREVPLEVFLKDNGTVQAVEYECKNDAKGIAWARSQVGHMYDWSGLFGFPFHRDWAHSAEWWCSELFGMAIHKAKPARFRHEVINRLTPQHCWMMSGKEVKLPTAA